VQNRAMRSNAIGQLLSSLLDHTGSIILTGAGKQTYLSA